MADAATISVLLSARDEASAQLKKVEGNMGRLAESFGKHRQTIGKAAIGIGAAITGIAVLSVKSALDQQIGIRQLDGSLKTLGTSYGENKKQIEALISAQQLKTNFGDEEQRKALQGLIQVTGDYSLSMDSMIPLMDMAAATGMNLESASLLVARAVSGETTALKRYGIEIDKNAGPQEVLNTLMATFAGQAELAADPITQLKNRVGDLFQVFGDSLLPVLEKILPKVEEITRKFIEFAEAHPTLTKVLGLLVAGLGGFLFVGGTLLIMLPFLIAGFVALNVAMGVVTVVILAITAAVAAGILIWKNWDKVVGFLRKAIADFASSTIDNILMLLGALKTVADATAKLIPWMSALADALGTGINKLKDMQLSIELWATGLQEVEEPMGGYIDSTGKAADATEEFKGKVTAAAPEIDNVGVAAKKAAQQIVNLTSAEMDMADALAIASGMFTDEDRLLREHQIELRKTAIEEKKFAEEYKAALTTMQDMIRKNADEQSEFLQTTLQETKVRVDLVVRQRDSWTKFERDLHPIMQSINNQSLSYGDVLALLAKDSDMTLQEMGEQVKQFGLTQGDTWGLINHDVAKNLEEILSKTEVTVTDAQLAFDKMTDNMIFNVSAQGQAWNDLGGNAESVLNNIATVLGMKTEDVIADLESMSDGTEDWTTLLLRLEEIGGQSLVNLAEKFLGLKADVDTTAVAFESMTERMEFNFSAQGQAWRDLGGTAERVIEAISAQTGIGAQKITDAFAKQVESGETWKDLLLRLSTAGDTWIEGFVFNLEDLAEKMLTTKNGVLAIGEAMTATSKAGKSFFEESLGLLAGAKERPSGGWASMAEFKGMTPFPVQAIGTNRAQVMHILAGQKFVLANTPWGHPNMTGDWQARKLGIENYIKELQGRIDDYTQRMRDWMPSSFAHGGVVGRGGMALVGELGPEIVNLPGGSFVHPTGTGPGGVTNQFHFHGAVYGLEDLKEAVVEAVRDHAISGGFSGVFAEA